MASTDLASEGTCLIHTCLKWTSDGELTPEDMQRVLSRLRDGEQIQRLRAAAVPHRPNLC